MQDYRVTLIAPDGREHVSRSASETNDLMYGHGYVRKPRPPKRAPIPPASSPEPSKKTDESK